MLVAWTVNHKEIGQAEENARWVQELGGFKNHDVLLCLTRAAMRFGAEAKLKPLLVKVFKTVEVFVPRDEVEIPWRNPQNDASSPNHFFKRVSQHTEWHLKRPFLWYEQDAVFLKGSALDEMEEEYRACQYPFMGAKLEVPGNTYMSGVAIYPANITDWTPMLRNAGTMPFDVFAATDIVRSAHWTKLIQYSPIANDVFPDWKQGDTINPEAVLYHRSKDLSLIDFLRGPTPSLGVHENTWTPEKCPTCGQAFITQAFLNSVAEKLATDAPAPFIVHPDVVKQIRGIPKRTKGKRAKVRTPKQMQAMRDRMQKARDARKKVAA